MIPICATAGQTGTDAGADQQKLAVASGARRFRTAFDGLPDSCAFAWPWRRRHPESGQRLAAPAPQGRANRRGADRVIVADLQRRTAFPAGPVFSGQAAVRRAMPKRAILRTGLRMARICRRLGGCRPCPALPEPSCRSLCRLGARYRKDRPAARATPIEEHTGPRRISGLRPGSANTRTSDVPGSAKPTDTVPERAAASSFAVRTAPPTGSTCPHASGRTLY